MSDQTHEVSSDAAVALAFLQKATPEILRLLETEVPTMVACGPERCAELGAALDGLRALDVALRDASVSVDLPADVAVTIDSVNASLVKLELEELPAPLAQAVAMAVKGVSVLAKFQSSGTAEAPSAPAAPSCSSSGEELLRAALTLIAEGAIVAGSDSTWKAALDLAPADATVFLSFDSPPPPDELARLLAKRGAPWLVDVESNEENRAWLSLLSRVFRVKGWPREDRILGCSFAPAIDVVWLDSEMSVTRVVKAEAKKDERFVLGIVLEPETVDSQKDIYSAAEIRQAAHKFMSDFGNVGLMHKVRIDDKVRILESYIAPCDFSVGKQEVKAGTWMLAVRVLDDELWKAVKKGELAGFSIGGSAIRRPERNANA